VGYFQRRLALLTAASLIAPVLLISQTLLARGRVDGLAIGAASMLLFLLLFLLVVLRVVGLVRQVEDQAAQLAALASHDGLTGMPNRRTWEGELPVAMDRAGRDGVPLSVALARPGPLQTVQRPAQPPSRRPTPQERDRGLERDAANH
jgi:hypothetical protein